MSLLLSLAAGLVAALAVAPLLPHGRLASWQGALVGLAGAGTSFGLAAILTPGAMAEALGARAALSAAAVGIGGGILAMVVVCLVREHFRE